MVMRRYIVMIAVASALAALGLPLMAQGTETYKVRLGWVPTAGAQRADVAGKGAATATLSGRTLSITGSFEGLVAPATAARLHRGVAKGARGYQIFELTVTKATSGTIAGSVALTPDQLESLKQGSLYIQLHSEKGVAPDGSNLWGWLLR